MTARVDSTTRRAQAIAHAADLLREGGPSALTSVAVAERMGVSQSAIYRHIRDMEELTTLASEVVIADLNAALHSVVLSPTIDWDDLEDVGRLSRQLIDEMLLHAPAFEVVDRWRFVDGPLGSGIRGMMAQGSQVLGKLLESRWRTEFGGDRPLDAGALEAQASHAAMLHEGGHTIIRLARERTTEPDHDELAGLLTHLIIGAWVAYAVDMNDRCGLGTPEIDLGSRPPG